METYRLTADGRRNALVLLVGALIIWAFALWTFRTTLGISYNPLRFFGSLAAAFVGGLGPGQIIPALLLLVLIVATPFVIWNIFEEYAASYTLTDDGLRFESTGVALTYPWSSISAIRRTDAADAGDEPDETLEIGADLTGQIANPVARFLHAQAYGRTRLPIYGGVERRDELIDEIRRRARLAELSA